MANAEEKKRQLDVTRSALEKLQTFDVETLPRDKELGSTLSFRGALEPAKSLIDLYRAIPLDVLPALSTRQLTSLKNRADSDFSSLESIRKFSPSSPSPISERDRLISDLSGAYDTTFDAIALVIAYAVRKSTDFARLEREAQKTISSMNELYETTKKVLNTQSQEAEAILSAIRKVAEEQGVSQQAVYFKTEAAEHQKGAHTWLIWTCIATGLLALYAVVILACFKASCLTPDTPYEAVQLAVGKVLIFATLSFFLLFSSRNFMAHRHNAVVNKHRQNALMTFEALVKAADSPANRDIVLTKASECIFSPQPTGFGKVEASDGAAMSILSVGPNAIRPTVT